MRRRSPSRARSSGHGTAVGLGGAHLLWAALLLVVPRRVIGALGRSGERVAGPDDPLDRPGGPGAEPDALAVTVARVLGARHAAEGLWILAFWPAGRSLAAAADALHALSAVAFAVGDRRWRRTVASDAAVEACFALAELLLPALGDAGG